MPLFKQEDSKRVRHAELTEAMATNVCGLNVSDDGQKLVIYNSKSFYLGDIEKFFNKNAIEQLEEKQVPTDKEAKFKDEKHLID